MKKIFGSVMLALLMMVFTCSALYAVPANPTAQQLTQPSGQKFYARLYGDEKFNWTATDAGDVLTRGTNGYWYYGQIKNKNLVNTNQRIGIESKPRVTLKRTEITEKLRIGALVRTPVTLKKGALPLFTADIKQIFPIDKIKLVKTEKILVLLVQFTNKSILSTDAIWKNAFFGTGLDSVNTYFKEVSGGLIQFAPAEESSGTANDGIVKVTLNYGHPNTNNNTSYLNKEITKNALLAADPYVNFAQFDTNNDGFISTDELHIVTIIAGYERSYGYSVPSVWAHRSALSSTEYPYYATTLDGKGIANRDKKGGYTQQGEIHENHRATIGIVCHELGHDLGLPDLYDYGYDSAGSGDHSLMAFGSWAMMPGAAAGSSPAHLDAWSKIKMGYATATDAFGVVSAVQPGIQVLNQNKSVDHIVYSFNTGKYNIIKVPTSKANEYFLIENRQFEGYDKGLSSYVKKGGIEILHIDESVTTNNDNQAHKLVDVEEANQAALGYSQLDLMKYNRFNSANPKLDSYYYAGNATVFGPASNPNTKLYTGVGTNLTITSADPISSAMKITVSKNVFNIIRPITNINLKPVTGIVRNPITR
jgi:M6 family metalloprotease-like protein